MSDILKVRPLTDLGPASIIPAALQQGEPNAGTLIFAFGHVSMRRYCGRGTRQGWLLLPGLSWARHVASCLKHFDTSYSEGHLWLLGDKNSCIAHISSLQGHITRKCATIKLESWMTSSYSF